MQRPAAGSSSSSSPARQQKQQKQQQQQQQQQQSYQIVTQYGDMLVVRQLPGLGQQTEPAPAADCPRCAAADSPQRDKSAAAGGATPRNRPVILTFHDIGLNSELQFANFCQHEEVQLMLRTFTMLHVNFPGQEARAERLPPDFRYPNVDQLAEAIVDVCAHLRVRSFVALAVGAGAHVAGQLALMRPDLVDGLFLVNPVSSGCSLTEWLYFKMSAIAAAHSQHHQHHHAQHESQHLVHQAVSAPEAGSPGGSAESPTRPTARLRRFLHAAHIHLPAQTARSPSRTAGGAEAGQRAEQRAEPRAEPAADKQQQQQQQQPPPLPARQAGSKLRRLILSRNFRKLSASRGQHSSDSGGSTPERGGRRGSASSASSADSGQRLVGADGSRRPPLEFLMYHHFGSAASGGHRPRGSPVGVAAAAAAALEQRAEAATAAAAAAGLSRSHESLAPEARPKRAGGHAHPDGAPPPPRADEGRRERSGSLCLRPAHLASLTSERLRAAYVQSVYRSYFGQVNAHNLWQFAQCFVKRHALSLRKDCGTAAHAAAALGTSICSAIVGVGVAQSLARSLAEQSSAGGQPADGQTGGGGGGAAAASEQQQQQQQQQQHALVAGTKVKRTFACQTLVMCSCVPLHCERAFKLMALLNPLQATCIKTDQLLVLEERPDKVCQALRLFLQGIGYSMPTFERRLRLSSAAGSAGSADSAG